MRWLFIHRGQQWFPSNSPAEGGELDRVACRWESVARLNEYRLLCRALTFPWYHWRETEVQEAISEISFCVPNEVFGTLKSQIVNAKYYIKRRQTVAVILLASLANESWIVIG